MEPPSAEVTALLQAWGTGDRSVEDKLFALVLPDLHRVAERLMRGERPDHSFQPTELLNEVYFKLVGARERDWQNRQHFLAVSARAMRHLLIDHARGRPSGQKLPLDGLEGMLPGRPDQLELALAIDSHLNELQTFQPDWCSVVEMKFFMGLTDSEVAEALGVPLRTVQRRFGDARRWLFERLESTSWKTKPTTNS